MKTVLVCLYGLAVAMAKFAMKLVKRIMRRDVIRRLEEMASISFPYLTLAQLGCGWVRNKWEGRNLYIALKYLNHLNTLYSGIFLLGIYILQN